MPSVYIKTYGCQMNERDSEAVAAQLLARGYDLAPSEHVADVILLNTCSVRDMAEQKALNKMENLAADVRRSRPNVVLGFMLDSVRELLRVSRRVTNMTGALAEATQAHRQILDAVAAGEAETARQAMRAHLLTVTSVWAPGGERPELTAAIGRGKERETEAVNV